MYRNYTKWDMQKRVSTKQLTEEETSTTPSADQTKKEFLPTQSN